MYVAEDFAGRGPRCTCGECCGDANGKSMFDHYLYKSEFCRLQLCVTGSNLTGACKLVFKVARNERNDSLFVNSDVPGEFEAPPLSILKLNSIRKFSGFSELLIEGIGRASPIEDPEACIYGYGAVRFLTNAIVSSSGSNGNAADRKKHKTLGRRLARHGVVPLMVLHLQIVNEAVSIIQKWFQGPVP